jgi:hypothetical protein
MPATYVNEIHDNETAYYLPFFNISGVPALPEQMMEPITRKGIDGIAWRATGWRAPAKILTCKVPAANAAVKTSLIAAYAWFKGRSVTIYDAHGLSFANWVVTGVRLVKPDPKTIPLIIWLSTSYSSPMWLVTEWTTQYPYGSA